MIDFKKKDLYSSKKKDMERFLTNILITESQKDDYDEIDDEAVDGLDDFMSDGFDDFEGFDDSFGGFDDFGSGGFDDSFSVKDDSNDYNKEENLPYNTENFLLNILIAPYYLFLFMFKSIASHKRLTNKNDILLFLNNQVKVSSVVLLITLFLLLFTEATFIFSLTIQSVLSVVMIGASVGAKILIEKGLLGGFDKSNNNSDEDYSLGEVDDSEFGEDDYLGINKNSYSKDTDNDFDFDFNDLGENDKDIDVDIDIDFDSDFDNDLGDFDFDNLDDDIDFDDMDDIGGYDDLLDLPEEYEEDEEEELVEGGSPIPHSKLNVKDPMNLFLKDLENIYNENEKYRGVEIYEREELVKSLSGYLVANDRSFGKWTNVKENSIEYNNIMYTIYLALIEIQHAFKDITDRSNKMIINSCVENPLMYRIEFEVPKKYFKAIEHKKDVFESKLKVSDADKEVLVMISSYREGFVLKIVKPAKSFVSLGDILRFHNDQIADKQVYQKYLDAGTALPLVLGLRDVEYPEIVDLADNTSVVIAGESGSGKSWGTFLVMMNLIFSNTYNDLNVVIMDRKKAVFWREFANMPHVIGYHTDVPKYFDLLKELNEEMEYRKEILQKAGVENWKSLRKGLIKAKKYKQAQAFPWLMIIIDEVSNTQKEIKAMDDGDELLKDFDNYLTMIAQEGRSLGMKLVLIGQRTTADAMPRNAMNSSSLKFLFKLSDADMERAIKLPKNVSPPQVVGQAILKDMEMSSPVLLRTLTVGGIDDDQIINIIRILAFEWNRRAEGNVLTKPRGMNLVYNRHIQQEKVLEDMKKGKLFISEETNDLSVLAEAVMKGEDISKITEDDLLVKKPLEEQKPIKINVSSKDKFKDDSEDFEDDLDLDDINFNDDFDDDDFDDDFNEVNFNDDDFEDDDFDLGFIDRDSEEDLNFDIDDFDNEDLVSDEEEFEFDFDFDSDEDIIPDGDNSDDEDFEFDFDFDLDDFDLDDEVEDIGNNILERDTSLSVKEYIKRYGEGNKLKKIRREELEEVYESKIIKRALLKSEITLDNDYYRI